MFTFPETSCRSESKHRAVGRCTDTGLTGVSGAYVGFRFVETSKTFHRKGLVYIMGMLCEFERGMLTRIWVDHLMIEGEKDPRKVDPNKLWALFRTQYRDGDEVVDGNGEIWDLWRKAKGGYALFNVETKEIIDVPKPEEFN